MSDIVKRLRGEATIMGMVGADPLSRDMLREAAAEIERLREERRWISVEEGVPEVGVDVLAMSGEGVFQANVRPYGDSLRWEPLILDYHGCGCCGGSNPRVTHWMPLPAPPEEGS